MIEPIDESFAALLRQNRLQYIADTGVESEVKQVGAAYIEGDINVPVTPFALTAGEPAIETFVCGSGTTVHAMGDDENLIDLWRPAAQQLSNAVYRALEEFNVDLEGPGYLTVSALPLAQVSHEPHFDDDQFIPNDGVSVVAIIANYAGTRCTTYPIKVARTQPDLPITLPLVVQTAFDDGTHASTLSEPDRIVIFPQFAQLHSGPDLTDLSAEVGNDTLRTLLVFRCKTQGTVAEPRRRRR